MYNLPEILAQTGSILLDNSERTETDGAVVGGRISGDGGRDSFLFHDPVAIIRCTTPADVPRALDEIDAGVSRGLYAAGYLAYECGYRLANDRFEEATRTDWSATLGYPILWFGLYERMVTLDGARVDELLSCDRSENACRRGCDGLLLTPRTKKDAFADAIRRIRELIHEGDLYQVNYTIRFDGELVADAGDIADADPDADAGDTGAGAGENSSSRLLNLFRHMRLRQPVKYAAFLQLGDVQILSASPEQFFHRDGNAISVRPMKGTAPRGQTSVIDRMLESWLQTDEKNRSENLMILDLLRNDLSRICVPGSVTADALFEIERYQTVLQMTSPVSGLLCDDVSYRDLFTALFPSGSITGAPKIRAMQRIRELEPEPRGIYCGSIGFIGPSQRASFSVAIRTVVCMDSRIVTGSGGGIVWDSDALEEHTECLLKTHYLLANSSDREQGICLLETMHCHGEVALLARHLRRLEESARHLEFEFDRDRVVREIAAHVSNLGQLEHYKIRLLLECDGSCSVSSESIEIKPGRETVLLGISTLPVHSGNPFLRHKTTFRAACDRARREAEELGLHELLFLNENQHITEGTITNVFLRHGERWSTPPLSSGLLSGIGREIEMESERRPREALLTVADLRRADEIILTNAVRGRRQAKFVE